MAASSSEAALHPQPLVDFRAVEAYLENHHKGSWHTTLNNHASTRPKEYGGPLVHSVTSCKMFTASGSASDNWVCVLHLPNSFEPNDGIELHVEGQGKTNAEASDSACRRAMAQLLSQQPSQVILRPRHWTISLAQLLAGMPGAGVTNEPLPVHVPARHREAGADAAANEDAG